MANEGKILNLKSATKPQRATHTKVDTLLLTPESVEAWKDPPFQRPLKVNPKVVAIAEMLKAHDGVVSGMITLGIFENEIYLVDGQHRRKAFLLSELKEGFADVRYHWFDSMAEMSKEWELLNTPIVRMRPDDLLRAREMSSPGLMILRKACPFVGYSHIRLDDRKTGAILSMSMVLRAWFGSETDAPSTSGYSATDCAARLTIEEAQKLIVFLKLLFDAWGRDEEYGRLWRALNFTLVAWLYRRTVINQEPYMRSTKLTERLFKQGLMALSANDGYLDYLSGRLLTEISRTPTYNRMKIIFASRLDKETGEKHKLPQPDWAHHTVSRSGSRNKE